MRSKNFYIFCLLTLMFSQSMATGYFSGLLSKPTAEKKLVDWLWYNKKPFPNAKENLQKEYLMRDAVDMNYMQRLRRELTLAQNEKQLLSKKRGVLKHQAIELPVMTLGFFIANGLVNYVTLWDKSGGNPLKFEEQLMAQTDPITHFSFYAFMLANGIWMDYRSTDINKMPEHLRHAMFRRIMYQGLALGSLASSIVADMGQLFKDCATPLGKTSPQEIDMICNEALKRWTVSAKTQQYLPQILTLLVVQGATDFLHATSAYTIKYTASQLYSVIQKMGPKSGFVVDVAKVVLMANPSRIAIKSISLVGLATNLTFFVAVDHLLNVPLNRLFTNIVRPPFFLLGNKANLDCYMMWGDRYYWVKDTISLYQPECGASNMFRDIIWNLTQPKNDWHTGEDIRYKDKSKLPSAKFEESFLSELDSFSMVMQDWRNNINSDVEAKLQGWMTMTNRILNQIVATEKFYKGFSADLFNAMQARLEVSKGQKAPVFLQRSKDFPFRDLPLYGVKFEPWMDSVKKEPVDISLEDAYLMFPVDTTKQQSLFLQNYSKEFLTRKIEKLSYFKIVDLEYKAVLTFMEALSSGEIYKQSRALHDFNSFYYGQAVQNQTVDFKKLASVIMHEIGPADPKLLPGQGFAAAFELANKQLLKQAEFDLFEIDDFSIKTLKTTSYSTASEYLYQAMICGKSLGYVEEYFMPLTNEIRMSPDFRPPLIIDSKKRPMEFCEFGKKKGLEFKSWEDFYFRSITDPVSQTSTGEGIISYIAKNYDPKVVGNISDKSAEKPFDNWFKSSTTSEVQVILNRRDQQYQSLISTFEGNLSKRVTPYEANYFNEHGLEEVYTYYKVNKSVMKQLLDSPQALDLTNMLGEDWVSSIRNEQNFYLYLIQYLNSGLRIRQSDPAPQQWSFMADVVTLTQGKEGEVLKTQYTSENAAIANVFNSLLKTAELEPKNISYAEYLKLILQFKNLMKPLVLAIFEDDLSKKMESESDDIKKATLQIMGKKIVNGTFDEILAITKNSAHLTTKSKIILRSVEALLNIQEQITRAVRMKVLMTQGLSFKESELRQQNQGSSKGNCIPKPGGGCR